jgi:prophage antirepressor-like protein
MSRLTAFYFGKIQLRVVVDNHGYAQFVSKDVATALGYKDPINALKSKVDAEDKDRTPVKTAYGTKELNVINESGLFSFIRNSHSKRAKQFRSWVTSEVLSRIAKYGRTVNLPVDSIDPITFNNSKLSNTGTGELNTMTPEQRLDFIKRSIDLMRQLGELPEQDKEVYRATIRALTLEVQPQHELQPEQNSQSQQESTEQRYWQVREVLKEMGHSLDDSIIKEAGGKASLEYQQHYGSPPPKRIFRKRNGEEYSKNVYIERDLPIVKSCIQEAIDKQNKALKDQGLIAAIDHANEQNKQNGNH